MQPTDNKAISISQLVKDLEEIKKEHGDIEVLMPNLLEGCFDGVGKTVMLMTPRGDTFVTLIRNDVVIKI